MKKSLLLMVALTMAIAATAQGLQKAPRLQQPSPTLIARSTTLHKAQITPADDQIWWGYFAGNEDISTLGTGRAETFDMAIYIPAGHAMASDKKISAMRIYMADPSIVKDVKVWFSASLPDDIDAADYVQAVDASTLEADANDIALTTPYKNASGFYAGYTYTLTKAAYTIMQGGDYIKNGLFLRSSQTVTDWGEQSSFGRLALQLLVENTSIPAASATPEDAGPVGVELGGTAEVAITVTNNGRSTITEVGYTLTADGQTSAEMAAVPAEPIPYNAKGIVVVKIPAAAQAGKQTLTLTLTSVNGKANQAAERTASIALQTVAEMKEWPRTVLLEEFTTEYCGYCPGATQTMNSMFSNYPELQERVAVVCHHSGYYYDWLTTAADRAYEWFYNSNGTYAPAFMYDRAVYEGRTPVNGQPSNAAYMKWYVDERLNVPAHANIELQATFGDDKKTVIVRADCFQAYDFASTPARITLFLTEDNIKAQSQAGASGSFTHQHVLRAVNATWGKELAWSKNTAGYDYTFTLEDAWKTDDLKVIAFISGYDSKDPTNCVIENAAVTTVGTGPIVTAISAPTTPATTTDGAIYRLDGTRLTTTSQHALPKGIYVINGRKVVKK